VKLPLYGLVPGRAAPLLFPGYSVIFTDDAEPPVIVLGKYGNPIKMSPTSSTYTLTYHEDGKVGRAEKEGEKYNVSVKAVMLASAFPAYVRSESETCITKIDLNLPMTVGNLYYCSRTVAAQAAQEKSVQGERNGVPCYLLDENGEVQYDASSVGGLAHAFVENFQEWARLKTNKMKKDADGKWIPPTERQMEKVCRRNIEKPTQLAYGRRVIPIPPAFIEGEIWKPVPEWYYPETGGSMRHEVSNRGRMRQVGGNFNFPQKIPNSKYRDAGPLKALQPSQRNLHRVIYEAFHGKIPPGLEVDHDLMPPLDEDGCHRNWLEDLTLVTRSGNMRQFHAAKRQRVS
jgi:hypothetical protein